jgi:hypothetical protein
MPLRFCILAVAATVLGGGTARADFAYEFATTSGTTTTFGSSFSVPQGSTIALQVYLVQTNGPTVNSTNLSANGLLQGGVSLSYTTTSPFSIASTSAIAPSAAFGGSSNPNNNTSLSTASGTTTATVQVASSTAVFPTTTDASGNAAILLGTFTFTGNSTGSATTVTALPNANTANNVDGANNNLDSLIQQSSAVITVTAVPEPGSAVLSGLFALGLAGVAARRLRRAPATA